MMVRCCSIFHGVFFFIVSVCYFADCHAQYVDSCTPAHGRITWKGDGDCNWENNNVECSYDGGDCCPCTCLDSIDYDYSCGINGYSCVDPNALGDDDGQEICSDQPTPCRVGVQKGWLVENTADAQALAEEVKCSGGEFQVEWRGRVVVPTTIEIIDGTVLNVTGVGSSAVLDGNGTTRLFRVMNASLSLTNVGAYNGNATYGGALAVSGSSITFDRTAFINNTAFEKRGGALFAHDESILMFDGESYFYNNRAFSGGAVYISRGSNASWTGNTTFSNNAAYAVNGGAVAVLDGSSASWTGNAIFLGNTASIYRGGAVSVEDGSKVSWSSSAIFVANRAGFEGGAIFIDTRSDVTLSGHAVFSYNTVMFNGGAVFIGDFSTIVWSGKTVFISNDAGDIGGAVASRAVDSGANPTSATEDNRESFLLINGTTNFSNNTCGANGGGMALLGGLSVTFETKELTFYGNKADVAGGGIFISATGVGPVITNASFISNSAEVGAGAFVTGSGTSTNQFGDLPTTFDGCRFIGNEAGATGGAIESAAGVDEIIDTIFRRNIARVGGALRLAGKAFLDGCSFEENVAVVEGGPAVYNIGYISTLSSCHFDGNIFNCDEGTFLNSTSVASSNEILEIVCKGCGSCEDCSYEEADKVPTCSLAMENSISPGGYTTTLRDLEIKPGYWRAASTSYKVLACYNADACRGGLTGASDFCCDGFEGPYCSICADNYVAGAYFTCNKCSDNVWGVVVAVVVTVLALLVAVNVILYLITTKIEGTGRGAMARVMHWVPLQAVKIVIVSWQILTQFATLADVIYPDVYQRFVNAINVLNFDLTWVLSAGCVVDVDFHGRLLILTIGPIVVFMLLGGTYVVAVRRNRRSEAALVDVRHKHVSMILLVMFLVYSSVSNALFQMFDCEDLDDGKNYLRADYSIECDKPRHKALSIYAGFMIILYPIGIPIFFAALLFRNRNVLTNKSSRERALMLRSSSLEQRENPVEEDILSVRSTSDLWKPYKPSRFYYEVVECGRRIVLTGVILVVDDDSAAQVSVTLMLATMFALLSEGLAPYESHLDMWVSRLGHAVVLMSMYFALLLKVDVSEESQPSQRAFEVVLVVTHAGMILSVVVEAIATGYSLSKQQLEDPMPRARKFSEKSLFTAAFTRGASLVDFDSLPGTTAKVEPHVP